MSVASKGFAVAMGCDESGSEPKPKSQMVAYVDQTTTSLPSTKPDGSPLVNFDYIRPKSTAIFPFTIDGITITNKNNVIYYSTTLGWYLSTNGMVDTIPVGFTTNTTVGALEQPAVIGGKTAAEVIQSMTKKDLAPGLSLNNIATLYSKGSSVNIELKATVTRSDSDITKIEFYKDSTLVHEETSGVSTGGTFSYTYVGVNDNTELKVKAYDATNSASASKNLEFIYPSYIGFVETTTQEKLFKIKSQSITYNSEGEMRRPVYKYPKSYGELTSITDKSGADDYMPSFEQTEETIGGIQYYVYTKIDPAKLNDFIFIFT